MTPLEAYLLRRPEQGFSKKRISYRPDSLPTFPGKTGVYPSLNASLIEEEGSRGGCLLPGNGKQA